jgi:hypothetical protein
MKNRNWHLTFRRWLNEDLQTHLRRLQDIYKDAMLLMRRTRLIGSLGQGKIWKVLCKINLYAFMLK